MTEKNEKSNQTKPNFKIQLDNISIESDLNGIKIQEKEPTKNEKKEKAKGLSPEATKYFAEQFIDKRLPRFIVRRRRFDPFSR